MSSTAYSLWIIYFRFLELLVYLYKYIKTDIYNWYRPYIKLIATKRKKNFCFMIRDRCLFQENYASVKKGGSLSHKEVMKELSSAFSRGVNV